MAKLHGFRPPQFSEEDAWLPCWLQQCKGEWLGVESINEDYITFEERVEEFLCHRKDNNNGGSLRDETECNIGQLFISGTDSSPFSCAQSANNVVHFLCLSSDAESENVSLSDDACEAEPNSHAVTQPHETIEILVQKDAKLSMDLDAGALNHTQTVEEIYVNKNELLKHEDSESLSQAASDAVELCIAASEALVINEITESDSLEKPSSASAILEASLQLKQARLEVLENTFLDSFSEISDVDNLSDLDDITMGSAYEDAGIRFMELPGTELSVSHVKDTLESEFEELEHKKIGASAFSYDNDIQLRQDLTAHYCGGDTQKEVTSNTDCDRCTGVAKYSDYLRTIDAQANCHLSVSAEEVNTLIPENNPHEIHLSSSPIMSCRDEEKDDCQPNQVQERFQSRWLGGWSNNNQKKYVTIRCNIPEPFVGQTSFLSESACTAPDVNSFVQNHDKQATIASQLSIPSENCSRRANDAMMLSQDVGSSSASLVDPLCSVVPCSISENLCSSPTINYGDPILASTIECKKDGVLGITSLYNMPAEEENTSKQTAYNNDPGNGIARLSTSENGVSRLSTSLRHYSMLLPSHTEIFGEYKHQKSSLLIERSSKFTFEESSSNREEAVKAGAERQVLNKENSVLTPSHAVNHSTEPQFQTSICSKLGSAEENPTGTTQPERTVNSLPCENPQPHQLQCENRSVQKLPAGKRVRFSERDTNIPVKKRIRKSQTVSKPCYSATAAKRLTRSSAHVESRDQQIDRFLRVNLDKKKKRLIFQNMEFLLTGFSQRKEKEIEGLIRKYGGMVLSQIPSTNSKGKRSSRSKSWVLPVVLCLKKIQSFKFLYGCAVNAYVMRINWLIDSIAAGFVLQPERYMIISRSIGRDDQVYTPIKYNTHSLVFNNLGVMLHGKTKYFTNIATILKHGGGQVFKTLQGLIQMLENGKISTCVVVADEESRASRHLRHCALEHNIPMTSVSWIIKCLYAGKLIPLEEKRNSSCLPATKPRRQPDPMELSQEI